MLDNMGYWQNGLEIEKQVCYSKVPLGCLGLTKIALENQKLFLKNRNFRLFWGHCGNFFIQNCINIPKTTLLDNELIRCWSKILDFV